MPDKSSSLAPFKHGTFRAIWTANLASSFGGLIQGVGAAWLMTSIADSVDMVALVQASTSLPIMLFSLVGGAIADSFNRRRVMLAAQFFMLAVSIALTLCAYFGLVTPWLLLGFTFLIGCGTALNNPSWQASVGDLVPRSDLSSAVVLNSIGFNLSRSVGPAVGGIIVATAGAAAAFAVNAASYLPLLTVLLRWKPVSEPSTLPRETMGSAMLAGVNYVAMSPNICKVLLRAFVFGFTAIAVLALLPVVASSLTQGGPLIYGVMLGSFGVGAVGGAFLRGQLQDRLRSEVIVRLAFVGFAVCAGISAISTSPWPTCLALMLGGACWVLALSLFNVTVQLSTPRWVVGRALSLYQTASFGGMALGSWLWGVAADEYGIQVALIGAGLLMLVGALIGVKLPLPGEVAVNLDPVNSWTEPHLELDVLPRSGPITIRIEYTIKSEDVMAFLTVMAERRGIRLRNGARNWSLMRDLGDPKLWVETYQSPTWTEYIRHNQRMTHADAEVADKIRALHAGPGRPVVHRLIERHPAIALTKGFFEPTLPH